MALLGVLKAGGAYVPMDPSYPPGRLALMMEDSEVRVRLALLKAPTCSGGPPSQLCCITRRRQCC